MTIEPVLTPRAMAVLTELQAIIAAHYLAAALSVCCGIDDPDAIELWTTVDVEDTDLVLDVVIDRAMVLHIDEGLPSM